MLIPKVFGALPSGERLKKIKNSPNYKNGKFQNRSETKMMSDDTSMLKVTKDFIFKPKSIPANALPSVKSDLKNLPDNKLSIVWFGHSSYLVKIGNKHVLVDPVFSGHASPFSFMVSAFKGTDVFSADDLPPVDVLLLTHDHYDHLDYKFVTKIRNKVGAVVCSLGVAAHLECWGYDKKIVTELDWEEECTVVGIKFTAVTARHFSGRSIKREQSLWSSFILQTQDRKVFVGGDSGYDTHFKEVGTIHGPFDIALLEAGQYNTAWRHIHMMPEETVLAAMDLKAKILMPVHWGKFALAMHDWKDPIERVTAEAKRLKVKIITPKIGERVIVGETEPQTEWWNF